MSISPRLSPSSQARQARDVANWYPPHHGHTQGSLKGVGGPQLVQKADGKGLAYAAWRLTCLHLACV